MSFVTKTPEQKRIGEQIAAERTILMDQLEKAKKEYPKLKQEADYAVNRQMRVYSKMQDIEERLVKLDVIERELG